jgi:hypothetical protein
MMMLLVRSDRRVRQAQNQRRYRMRRAMGQTVCRVTVNSERLLDLLVAKDYLPDNVIHDDAMVERALTRFIDDETRKINRYR